MLEEVLTYLRNWFIAPDGVHTGEYEIKNGGITLPFLVSGQYFRVCNSTFNDGVYQYGDSMTLTDETFEGAVWALKVPPNLITLVGEIEAWSKKYGSESPYTSESFGGYTYQRATTADGTPISWKKAFAARLAQWRKL